MSRQPRDAQAFKPQPQVDQVSAAQALIDPIEVHRRLWAVRLSVLEEVNEMVRKRSTTGVLTALEAQISEAKGAILALDGELPPESEVPS
jgi:hypothetical protein